MEEKLNELYNECIEELKSIGINVIDNELIGEIDIHLSKRNTKGDQKYPYKRKLDISYTFETLYVYKVSGEDTMNQHNKCIKVVL